jgi:hypothetical protein
MPLSRQARPTARRKERRPAGLSGVLKQLSSEKIAVPKRHEVLAYLTSHKQLAKLLPAVGAQVRHAFGPQAELSLELYRDPEIDDRYLTLYVRQETYDWRIMEKIEAESRQFNERLEQVSGYLLVTTDFRRPRNNNAI